MGLRTWLALVAGGILFAVVVTTAQRFQPSHDRVKTQSDNVNIRTGDGQVTMTGNVIVQADGVSLTVSADRITLRDGEYQLEGNVRMTVATP